MKAYESWTFDVALSFSGANRESAREIALALRERGLTVFFDEWFKADTWGKDLVPFLRGVYERARYCLPLLSKDYVTASFAKHELHVMLERELLTNSGSLLPVRLDDAEIPGIGRMIAFIDFATTGPAGIADLVSERLKRQVMEPFEPADSMGSRRSTGPLFWPATCVGCLSKGLRLKTLN